MGGGIPSPIPPRFPGETGVAPAGTPLHINDSAWLSEPLQEGQRIHRRRAGRGVVENAPDGTIASQIGQLPRQPLDPIGAVWRIVDARGSVQPNVGKAVPSAWSRGRAGDRRVGRDASDAKFRQQTFGARREPVRMTRFAGDGAVEAPPQRGEERTDRARIESETRRKLKQERTELGPEPG